LERPEPGELFPKVCPHSIQMQIMGTIIILKNPGDFLVEAGYDQKNPVPEISLVTTPEYVDLCKFVQSQLKDVGFNIAIEVSPTATVREQKANGKFENHSSSL